MLPVTILEITHAHIVGRIGEGRVELPVAGHKVYCAHYMRNTRELIGNIGEYTTVTVVNNPVGYIM